MKHKHFYEHLVPHQHIQKELDILMLKHEEKINLLLLFHANLHLLILDIVLDGADTKTKDTILDHIENDEHDKTWEFLRRIKPDIEMQIKNTIEKHIEHFRSDIAQVKQT